MKFDHVIGAYNGVETKYMVVKLSVGEIHGHPISEALYKQYLK
jgi:hypothetical protein